MLTGACNKSEISVTRVFDRELAAFPAFALVDHGFRTVDRFHGNASRAEHI